MAERKRLVDIFATARSKVSAAAALALHGLLRASLWVCVLATTPRIPGGAFMRTIAAGYAWWRRRADQGIPPRLVLAAERTCRRLPDPPLLMVLLACSGVLMLPAGRGDETALLLASSSRPGAYRFIEPPSCWASPAPTFLEGNAPAAALDRLSEDLVAATGSLAPELLALAAEPESPAASARPRKARSYEPTRPESVEANEELCAAQDDNASGPPQPATDDTADSDADSCRSASWWTHGTAIALIEGNTPEPADAGERFGAFLEEQDAVLRHAPATAAAEPPSPDSVADTADGLRQLRYRIRSGQTISDILDAAGVRPSEVKRWVEATQRVYDLDRVYAGQAIALDVDGRGNDLRRLALDIDPQTRLVAERQADSVVARRDPIQFERRIRMVSGRIDHSLYMAAVSRGVPDRVISDVAEVLGWEVNFSRDLRPGATFRIVYEELVDTEGTKSHPGRVLAVDLLNRGRHYEAFYFRSADQAVGGYYDREGHALGRAFLRYPVAYSRISSKFSRARLHPVLKKPRPHYGVDFAAPAGTPVHAIAAGTVTVAGWHGASGRMVKIRHDDVYESAYAHLSRIAPGVRTGTPVAKGQVIGYVGSTGLATGPHLHLALYKHGKYVDPLTVALPRAPALEGAALARFQQAVASVDRAYASAPGSDVRLTRLAAAFDNL